MKQLIGIKLSPLDMPRFFRPHHKQVVKGDFCVVENPFGEGEKVGFVVSLETCHPNAKREAELPGVIRQASPKDIMNWRKMKDREAEALQLCKEKVIKHKLEMKVSVCRIEEQANKIVFNFTADQRVDFRELVKDLASSLKSRIELWQIGVRDEAKMLDGCGLCGQRLCCSSWIKEFQSVSIKHARAQDILRAPAKLAGICGRLRCCMTYEHEVYCELCKKAPVRGSHVKGDGVEGVVVDRNLLKQEAVVYSKSLSKNVAVSFASIMEQGNAAENELPLAPIGVLAEPGDDEEQIPDDENSPTPEEQKTETKPAEKRHRRPAPQPEKKAAHPSGKRDSRGGRHGGGQRAAAASKGQKTSSQRPTASANEQKSSSQQTAGAAKEDKPSGKRRRRNRYSRRRRKPDKGQK